MPQHDKLAVVDFGGQYAHLIATKIRRLRVLAEICQPEDPLSAYEGFAGIILSGSPALASQGDDAGQVRQLFDLPVPILGFCFGHQLIAEYYGGRIEHTGREFGPIRLNNTATSDIFFDVPDEHVVWMSHGDSVTELPKGFLQLGVSVAPDGTEHANAAIGHEKLRRYGFQFHPEVDDTEYGDQMLANFTFRICGCQATWTMEQYIAEQSVAIQQQAGDRGVFLLASGGVDSTVCAKLLGQALGPERLHLLHIDNGLMRKDESQQVIAEFERLGLGEHLHFVDASARFLSALSGEIEPERKRRIIGNTFIDVFQDEAKRLQLDGMLLGQGTIYPDTIETGGTKRADTIKTHHNRVPIIEEMIAQGRVIEPIKELYKVEVRELGERLGVDPALVWRHPFPGPGLGVRLLCADGSLPEGHDPDAQQGEIDVQAERAGLQGLLLPARSVGVKADLRCYEQPVLLWGQAAHGTLVELAAQIYQRVPGVNRCVWDLTGRGASRAAPVAAATTAERLALLREADAIVMEALGRHGLMREIWQCPTALLPLSLDGKGQELVVLRPVHSERAMTASPAPLPTKLVDEIRDPILSLGPVSGLVLDVTTKPPGTIEWE